jgi:hypothetical protein
MFQTLRTLFLLDSVVAIRLHKVSAQTLIAAACICIVLTSFHAVLVAQPYMEGNTQRRFAQMYLAADVQTQLSGGQTTFLGANGERETLAFSPRVTPRLTIGGMHFWGHADFYVTFELPGVGATLPQRVQASTGGQALSAQYALGIETGARLYPWRVEREALRPFVGFSWSSGSFQQTNAVQAGEQGSDGVGPRAEIGRVAVQTGAAYQIGDWILEGGVRWFPAERTVAYPLSRSHSGSNSANVTLPNAALWIMAKYTFETTLPEGMNVEQEAAFDERKRRYAEQARRSSPNGLDSWTVAAGPSAVFTIGSPEITGANSYNATHRPYLNPTQRISVMPDLGVGYYSHLLDAQINLALRPMQSSSTAYGVTQTLNRTALHLEAFKFLFDYQGFVPFVGLAVGSEFIRVRESVRQSVPQSAGDEGVTVTDVQQQQWSAGVVFGWDIRPSATESWLLRTNLRYTPNVRAVLTNPTSLYAASTTTPTNTSAATSAISLPDFEFNFIQVVVFLDRVFK